LGALAAAEGWEEAIAERFTNKHGHNVPVIVTVAMII